MSNNQHTQGVARSPNQKNSISDDPADGARLTDTLKSPAETEPGVDDQDTIEAFGRRGQPQDLPR